MGFANRKLGRYDEALVRAYAQALKINPDAVHAIEYQAEALLALNRIDDVRFNYWAVRAGSAASSEAAAGDARVAGSEQRKPPAGIDMPALAEWMESQAARVVPGEKVW